jgi:hypothetical protein
MLTANVQGRRVQGSYPNWEIAKSPKNVRTYDLFIKLDREVVMARKAMIGEKMNRQRRSHSRVLTIWQRHLLPQRQSPKAVSDTRKAGRRSIPSGIRRSLVHPLMSVHLASRYNLPMYFGQTYPVLDNLARQQGFGSVCIVQIISNE